MESALESPLTEYIPGQIWLKEYPVRYGGMNFSARMTIVRLTDGRLWIHSPCEIEAGLKAEIGALGPVAYIMAPGTYHHLHVESCQRAFPEASTHICPGIEKKRPELAFDSLLGAAPDAGWAADLDQVPVLGGRFFQEVAFFHKPSCTLILVDLIENYGDASGPVDWLLRFWWKFVFRMWNRPKPAPEYQFGWGNKAAARESLEQILAWEFERIIIAHGDLIETNARQVARTAWRQVLGK
jgi:hypothetical protein